MAKINSFRELRVYQELKQLHLDIDRLSLEFPKHEMYELGSQIRRSSNSAPANLAEGWGSRHTNIYIESINRALGELRETQHHLSVALDKGYLAEQQFSILDDRLDHCSRMLERLHQSLSEWKGSTRTGDVIREASAPYASDPVPTDWQQVIDVTNQTMSEDL